MLSEHFKTMAVIRALAGDNTARRLAEGVGEKGQLYNGLLVAMYDISTRNDRVLGV
jgi:hypothetical protein